MGDIYLIRHGQTEWNKEKRFRGAFDVPLNDQGREEAACAAGALRDISLMRIYASPLSRAMETAQIVSSGRAIEVVADNAFLDIDYGEWTKMLDAQVQRKFPKLHVAWLKTPHLVRFPGGETLAEVRQRAVARLRELAAVFAGEAIAVVSHRVTLKLLLAAAKGLDDSHFWNIAVDTAAIALLRTEGATLRLVYENDTRHLDALPGHDSIDF